MLAAEDANGYRQTLALMKDPFLEDFSTASEGRHKHVHELLEESLKSALLNTEVERFIQIIEFGQRANYLLGLKWEDLQAHMTLVYSENEGLTLQAMKLYRSAITLKVLVRYERKIATD